MSSVTSTSASAYTFKYFPRYGNWTKEMQIELDEHSRQMAKLMIHVQCLYQSKKQSRKDQQREDTDADCMNHFYQEDQFNQFQQMPIDQFNSPASYTVYFQPIQYTSEGFEHNGCTNFHCTNFHY
ncbi:unnamed protein product [Caenorhabditis nigoni]